MYTLNLHSAIYKLYPETTKKRNHKKWASTTVKVCYTRSTGKKKKTASCVWFQLYKPIETTWEKK